MTKIKIKEVECEEPKKHNLICVNEIYEHVWFCSLKECPICDKDYDFIDVQKFKIKSAQDEIRKFTYKLINERNIKACPFWTKEVFSNEDSPNAERIVYKLHFNIKQE